MERGAGDLDRACRDAEGELMDVQYVWVEDDRFRCPKCIRLIRLQEVSGPLPPGTSLPLVATCEHCQRAYTAEEWRVVNGPFRGHGPRTGGSGPNGMCPV